MNNYTKQCAKCSCPIPDEDILCSKCLIGEIARKLGTSAQTGADDNVFGEETVKLDPFNTRTMKKDEDVFAAAAVQPAAPAVTPPDKPSGAASRPTDNSPGALFGSVDTGIIFDPT
ncbi:MAG: hypothetical protein IJ874_03250 [Ruminococcus sp.]|nr:hypothetical protein [Ruminococcus sp.]